MHDIGFGNPKIPYFSREMFFTRLYSEKLRNSNPPIVNQHTKTSYLKDKDTYIPHVAIFIYLISHFLNFSL